MNGQLTSLPALQELLVGEKAVPENDRIKELGSTSREERKQAA